MQHSLDLPEDHCHNVGPKLVVLVETRLKSCAVVAYHVAKLPEFGDGIVHFSPADIGEELKVADDCPQLCFVEDWDKSSFSHCDSRLGYGWVC